VLPAETEAASSEFNEFFKQGLVLWLVRGQGGLREREACCFLLHRRGRDCLLAGVKSLKV
jgi:hypothetical protein